MPKLRSVSLLVGLLVVCVIFIGSSKVVAQTTDLPAPVRYTYAASHPGMGMYLLGAAVAGLIERELPGSSITVTEGGTIANVSKVGKGTAQLGYSKPVAILSGLRGEKPFGHKIVVYGLAGITSAPVHIAITKSSGITSLSQIFEKKFPIKIAVGVKGDSSEKMMRQILEVYGLTYKDIKSWGGDVYFVPGGDGSTLIKDGHANAQITPSKVPHPLLLDLFNARDMVLLSIEQDVIKKLSAKYGYAKSVIPSGYYKGVDYKTVTIDDPQLFIANKNVPDEFGYWFAKNYYSKEWRQRLGAAVGFIKNITPEIGYELMGPETTPIHPGALRFYKEIGLVK